MNLKKAFIEISNSGIIPLCVGGYIAIDSSELVWNLIGVGLVGIGLILGDQYTKKSRNTSELRSKEPGQ